MGHNQEEFSDAYKKARGLTRATLSGSSSTIDWRIQAGEVAKRWSIRYAVL
jgi:hypothetical protein